MERILRQGVLFNSAQPSRSSFLVQALQITSSTVAMTLGDPPNRHGNRVSRWHLTVGLPLGALLKTPQVAFTVDGCLRFYTSQKYKIQLKLYTQMPNTSVQKLC
jgi:hypothetical protein